MYSVVRFVPAEHSVRVPAWFRGVLCALLGGVDSLVPRPLPDGHAILSAARGAHLGGLRARCLPLRVAAPRLSERLRPGPLSSSGAHRRSCAPHRAGRSTLPPAGRRTLLHCARRGGCLRPPLLHAGRSHPDTRLWSPRARVRIAARNTGATTHHSRTCHSRVCRERDIFRECAIHSLFYTRRSRLQYRLFVAAPSAHPSGVGGSETTAHSILRARGCGGLGGRPREWRTARARSQPQLLLRARR
mmetsp:Transcript_45537/g.114576  ORF Transcript_45537/g.114576 Transcript_45537/m.114576 type:complete len:245 (-) Transcript_45537:850-1584(-)